MTSSVKHSEMLRLWGIQENLLQKYRGMFLASQSILLSFGATISLAISEIQLAFLVNLVLFGVSAHLLLIWLRITTERSKAVNFCQEMILQFEKDDIPIERPLSRLNQYLTEDPTKFGLGHLYFKEIPISGHQDGTRKKMQNLPKVFAWLWVIELGFSIVMYFMRSF